MAALGSLLDRFHPSLGDDAALLAGLVDELRPPQRIFSAAACRPMTRTAHPAGPADERHHHGRGKRAVVAARSVARWAEVVHLGCLLVLVLPGVGRAALLVRPHRRPLSPGASYHSRTPPSGARRARQRRRRVALGDWRAE